MQGSSKIDALCPTKITVQIKKDDETCEANVTKTHVAMHVILDIYR